MGKTITDLTSDKDYLSQMNSALKKELSKPKFMSMGAIAKKEGAAGKDEVDGKSPKSAVSGATGVSEYSHLSNLFGVPQSFIYSEQLYPFNFFPSLNIWENKSFVKSNLDFIDFHLFKLDLFKI